MTLESNSFCVFCRLARSNSASPADDAADAAAVEDDADPDADADAAADAANAEADADLLLLTMCPICALFWLLSCLFFKSCSLT